MANLDQPIGIRPARGVGSQHIVSRFRVDVTNSTNFFVGDVVDLDGVGVIPAAADAGVSVAGVCTELFDTNGNPVGAPNGLVTTKYLAASTAGWASVALAIPGAVFIAQTITGQTPTEDDIGLTTDHTAGTGDTVTAVSRHELTYSGGGLQFRIIGKVDEPSNAWGEHVNLYVVFNESAMGCSGSASV